VILVPGIDLVRDHMVDSDPLDLIALDRDRRLVDSGLYLCRLGLIICRDERLPFCVVLGDDPHRLLAL
jgi:hypothetical protein